MYNYLFGPVPSRRLGMSLGIDLVPAKVCSLNCVYCEAGETTKLTLDRKEYVLFDRVIAELDHYFASSPDPDYFTFSGSGEPTLNVRIGDVIKYLKSKKPDIPVAVLTNGTLLYDKNVRESLYAADLVLPSLDAGFKNSFQKINRPASKLVFNQYIQGLIDFRKEFSGHIWLEVFILPDYNDSETELIELKKIINKINPEIIQLNSLDRPGILPELKKTTDEFLLHIKDLWQMDNIKIISASANRKAMAAYKQDIESGILKTIARRPCTLEDLSKFLGRKPAEINKYLDVLEIENKITEIRQDRGIFYALSKH